MAWVGGDASILAVAAAAAAVAAAAVAAFMPPCWLCLHPASLPVGVVIVQGDGELGPPPPRQDKQHTQALIP